MPKTLEHARHRGLRAALAAAGGRVRDAAITSVVIKSAALISLVAATGCRIPTWGPPAPPPFPKAKARS